MNYLDTHNVGVVGFQEKPRLPDIWVNSGFFVVEPRALDYITSDDESWEEGPLTRLAADQQLMAYRHPHFWQCMDTMREKHLLQKLWDSGNPPWKLWR